MSVLLALGLPSSSEQLLDVVAASYSWESENVPFDFGALLSVNEASYTWEGSNVPYLDDNLDVNSDSYVWQGSTSVEFEQRTRMSLLGLPITKYRIDEKRLSNDINQSVNSASYSWESGNPDLNIRYNYRLDTSVGLSFTFDYFTTFETDLSVTSDSVVWEANQVSLSVGTGTDTILEVFNANNTWQASNLPIQAAISQDLVVNSRSYVWVGSNVPLVAQAVNAIGVNPAEVVWEGSRLSQEALQAWSEIVEPTDVWTDVNQ